MRALAGALCCGGGGVAAVHAVDVRLGDEAVLALAEAVRYCPSLTELKLNHVLANTAPARGALLAALARTPNPKPNPNPGPNPNLPTPTPQPQPWP